jgi:hypothetical protein
MFWFFIWLGISTANFVFQWATSQNWDRAVDITYFQGAALLIAWVVMKINGLKISR